MNEKSNNDNKKVNLNKFEEPITEYKSEKETSDDFNSDLVLNQMLEIGLKQIELGITKPHSQVMTEMKMKYNFN